MFFQCVGQFLGQFSVTQKTATGVSLFECLILATENTEKVTNADIVASALQRWALKIAKNQKVPFSDVRCGRTRHRMGTKVTLANQLPLVLNFASEV